MPSLSPAQERSIAHSNARINIWEGSTRGGKTFGSLLRWLIYVADAPPGELAMFGRTRDTIGRNAILQLQDESLFGLAARSVHYTFGAPLATILGRRVHVFGANDVQAEAKVRGSTFAGAYGDELTLLPREFLLQAFNRLSVPGSKFYGTTNPGPQAHWLRTDFLLRADEPGMNLRQFHFRLDDNPSLTDEFKAGIKATNTGMYYRRFVLGEWCNAEGAVYDMFDEDRHVVDVCPVIKRWLCCSVDYGTTNPFDAVLIGLGIDRRLYVVAEWRWDSRARRRQLTDAEYSAKLTEWLATVQYPGSMLHGVTPERVIVDPSATSFRVQLFRDRYQPALADNDVLDGIRLVSSLLSSGRLLIHRSCGYLVGELQGYCWDEKAAAKGEDAPVKRDDHSADALRYGIFTTRGIWRNLIVPAEKPRNYEEAFGLPM